MNWLDPFSEGHLGYTRKSWFWAQSLFWLIFTTITFYLCPHDWPKHLALIASVINTLFFIALVNINIELLLPRFMMSQSFLVYGAVIIILAILITPLKVIINNIFIDHFELSPARIFTDGRINFIHLLVISSLSSLVRIPLDWLKVQKEKKDLITKNIQTELQFLKNQINPHFLFNTLNNLYALTLKKSDQAPEVVLKLSEMMRYMLYECNEKEVSLKKELDYIKNYIELEKIRLSKSADIQITVNGQIENAKIAPLILIPFVENSFKHGLKLTLGESYVHINLEKNEDEIRFYIVNSKPTVVAGQFTGPKKPGGIGLTNVRKRLEILYPHKHELQIDDQPNSYSILLILNQKIK